ncbi:tyrosine-type recombinase/integrase [Canibacter oris]|uniref:Integrase n=1 Tax=Canibacter oris TaxID=1365628 RepID=A0A840DR94_9MICO|nr:tyrosine-type recombinase/integrase [Canibacter oris]MBB4072029.1 integrase [Canibacter oris]
MMDHTRLTLWEDTADLLKKWRLEMVAATLSKRTIDERLLLISNFMKQTATTPRNFSAADVVLFLSREDWSPSTRQSYHNILRAFSLWCVRVKVRADDPLVDIRAPRRPRTQPRPLPKDAIPAIYAGARSDRTRAYIKLALYAGLRIHEVAKVRGEDFDTVGKTLTVEGKGGVRAVIPLHEELVALAEQFPRRGYWFPTWAAPHVDRKQVYRAIKEAMTRAGYDYCTPHQLRHSYGTALVESGADLRTTQKLLRHASLETTQRYVDSSLERQTTALNALTFIL